MKKKTVRNSAFHQYDQMSLDSPLSWTLIAIQKNLSELWESSRTDPFSPYLGHIKVLHFFNGFLWFNLIGSINSNIKNRPA